MRLEAALVALLVAAGCASEAASPPPQEKKRPPRHTWDDDEIRAIDFPEPTTPPPRDATSGAARPGPAERAPPARPNVKLALAVYDVISWDDVKIRGGYRGSPVKGVVSLTGWLAKAKSSSRTEALVAAGREASLDVAEPLRALTGSATMFRVAVLDANDKGELELAVTALASASDEAQVAPATRVRIGAGEALVVGGHRSEEGETPQGDKLVLIEASR